MTKPVTSRTALFAILGILFGLVSCALVVEGILRFLPVFSGLYRSPVNASDPVSHYVPNAAFIYSRGWDFRGVNIGRTNNYGFINDQDYEPGAASPLVAVIGDSYVEAAMIPYQQTFHGILARSLSPRGRVYSFGMSGAPLSQYLAWASWVGGTFQPRMLVIVIVANDFDESLSRYNSVPGFNYFDDSQMNMPLVRVDYEPVAGTMNLRSRSALYRYVIRNLGIVETVRRVLSPPDTMQYIGNVPAVVETERVERSRRAVDTFLDRLPIATGLSINDIVLVVDGMRPSLYSATDLEEAETSYFSAMRRYMFEQARRRGYSMIDMQPMFVEYHRTSGEVFEFPDDGHWNETAHEIVAEAVRRSATYQRFVSPAL